MPGLGEIFGGAMSGFGEALRDEGKAEREAALKLLDENHQSILREHQLGVEHGYRTTENDQQNTARHEDTVLTQDRSDARNREDNAASLRRTGITEGGANSRNAATINADRDKDRENTKGKIFDDVLAGATEEKTVTVPGQNPEDQPTTRIVKVVNTAKAYQRLMDSGHPDLAARVKPTGSDGGGRGGGGDRTPGAIALPSRMASEPDGTLVGKGNAKYKKQGNQLIPVH